MTRPVLKDDTTAPEAVLRSAPDSVAYRWMDSDETLAAQCRAWRDLPAIGVDTEFVRTRTYFARLGLIQVHAGETNWLIDPLSLSHLDPFFEVLCDPGVTKIIHSGSEDIEIFNRLGDGKLAAFFDTQIAAALCGLGPSLSYQALVGDLIGIDVAKDQTRSDWLRRPLSDSQKLYAALDVAWLPQVYGELKQRLSALGRSDWLDEDCQDMVARTPIELQLEEQYRRFKLAWKLDAAGRCVLTALLSWREHTARARDLPRKHVLTDNDLLALARVRPTAVEGVSSLELEHSRSVSRSAQALVQVIEAAGAAGEVPQAPPPPLDPETKSAVKKLRAQIAETAGGLGLAPEFLCGRREMLFVLQYGRPSLRLAGWRISQLEAVFAPYIKDSGED